MIDDGMYRKHRVSLWMFLKAKEKAKAEARGEKREARNEKRETIRA